MNVVLTKTDQKFFGENGKQIMSEMKEYSKLSGKHWHPFNYDLGYRGAEEWHNALLEELKTLKSKKRAD